MIFCVTQWDCEKCKLLAMLSRECSSKNAATSYPRLRKYKSAPCFQINRWIPFRFSNKTFVRSVAISAGLIPGVVFARKERNLKFEEIRDVIYSIAAGFNKISSSLLRNRSTMCSPARFAPNPAAIAAQYLPMHPAMLRHNHRCS